MAQQFTHSPNAPHVSATNQDQRYFAAGFLQNRSSAGDHIKVMRFADKRSAELEISTYGNQSVNVSVVTHLNADQCEALARYLIDTAHDLRTQFENEQQGGAA